MALSHSTSKQKWGDADFTVLSYPCVGIVNGTVSGYVKKVWADFVKCYESRQKNCEEPTMDQIGRIKGMIKTLKTIEDSIRRSKVNVAYLTMKGLEEGITG